MSVPFRSYVLVSRSRSPAITAMSAPWSGPEWRSPAWSRRMPTATARSKSRACCVARARAGWRSVRWKKASTLRRGGIVDPRILVMGGFLPYEGEALVEYDLTPCVHSLDQIRQMDELARSSGKPHLATT